jgi:hypothetical protein
MSKTCVFSILSLSFCLLNCNNNPVNHNDQTIGAIDSKLIGLWTTIDFNTYFLPSMEPIMDTVCDTISFDSQNFYYTQKGKANYNTAYIKNVGTWSAQDDKLTLLRKTRLWYDSASSNLELVEFDNLTTKYDYLFDSVDSLWIWGWNGTKSLFVKFK